MIERQIAIGCITNIDYLKQIKDEWSFDYIDSQPAKMICSWCFEYFDKHEKAPLQNINLILLKKLKKKKVREDLSEEIEDILQDLSEDYASNLPDLETLLFETREYFTQRQWELHTEEVQALFDKGEILKARQLQEAFKFKVNEKDESIDLADDEVDKRIEEAFDSNTQNVVQFDGALGKFWNEEMTKGAFVSILAPEKSGKSYLLLEFMMRAYEQGKKVAFFQAGDMTEGQQLIRTAIYLTQKSNKEKFIGKQYIPVVDCVKNQNDTCNKRVRASKFGPFKEKSDAEIREEITFEELVEAKQGNRFYKNCFNCIAWRNNPWGTVWLEEFDNGNTPLTAREAIAARRKFFTDNDRVKLATYANGELTISIINNKLDMWAMQGFFPELILIDYADLIVGQTTKEMRHSIDGVWRGLRGISQKRNALTVSPTQADAKSYLQDLLTKSNFSEDKRKLAHVTAMYGLNQDTKGRERKLGIMRINKIVLREDGFHESEQVRVLQHLQTGQPVLDSFF